MDWKHQERAIGFEMDTMETELLHQRCADSYQAYGWSMNEILYGAKPFISPTRWQRFRNWLGDNRLTNAWLVLIGREDIDREYR